MGFASFMACPVLPSSPHLDSSLLIAFYGSRQKKEPHKHVVPRQANMWFCRSRQIKFISRAFSIACTRLLTSSLP